MHHVVQEDDIQTVFDVVDGAIYLRISVQVHNILEDYQRLIPVLKRILGDCVPYKN